MKRQYFTYLKEATGQSEASVDAVAKALARFEADTGHKDFVTFRSQQAIAFKKRLADQCNARTGEPLSKATLNSTLACLRKFFFWLAGQPGYKSKLQYSDSDYFNLSEKEKRVAKARRPRKSPSLEQVKHVLQVMPAETAIERRDRAVIAFALLTGARDGALASFRLKHVDLAAGCVHQDAREVRTKASKTFTTYFLPVGGEVRQIVAEWVTYLRNELLWSDDDPLFPATKVERGASLRFEASGLKRECWNSGDAIRRIFRKAFEGAGLDYYHPHSLRKTLTRLGEQVCKTPEEFKAWSQNIGHESVMTTFGSYGEVAPERQAKIMAELGQTGSDEAGAVDRAGLRDLARELIREMREED